MEFDALHLLGKSIPHLSLCSSFEDLGECLRTPFDLGEELGRTYLPHRRRVHSHLLLLLVLPTLTLALAGA
jgi:hypothetical protein